MTNRRGKTPRDNPHSPHVEGLPARRAALAMLDAVLRRGEPIDHAVHAACQRMPSDDRALAVAIAGDALRWLGSLDALIDGGMADPLPDDSKARAVLRIALIQLLRLHTAPHAVIATSLALLSGGPRRLVHAVLSRAQRDSWTLPENPPLPAAAMARWQQTWGEAMVKAAEQAWALPPPLDLRFASAEAAADFGEGASLHPHHRRLARSGRVEALPGYDDGRWWVQDLAATVAADLLGDGFGRAALDLCAAPGGKTMQLAAAGWQVHALDASKRRLERLNANLRRTGLDANIIEADLFSFAPDRQFDAVLLDAPCSATGTFRRHPDVLHRVDAGMIAERAELQQRLLGRAAQWVAPGGALIFVTCSLEPQEGEDVLRSFLAEHPDWSIDPARCDELPSGIVAAPEGWVRTGPGLSAADIELDGFFTVRLRAPDPA